ncbi:hypothetical protein D1113_03265, partial [Mycoplasmopsis gallopavonis]
LFTNKYNGDKYFRFLYYSTSISFILLFFLISLQPEKTYITDRRVEVMDGMSITINEKILVNEISYKWFWVALALAFLGLILSIVAKTKLGYLKNSIFLARKIDDTNSLKQKIREIEEGRVASN